MYAIKTNDRREIALPRNLNGYTMDKVIASMVEEDGDATCSEIVLDFSVLEFIEPEGVVVLSNLLEYLKQLGVKVDFTGLGTPSMGTVFLDDSGFFRQYRGSPIRSYASLRETTLPLKLVANPRAITYLYEDMVPWIAQRLKTTAIALGTIRVTLQEIFHNINDHSGVHVGCVFAQHFPKRNEIHIAISDFGTGIPHNVRKVHAEIGDPEALIVAVKEGFSTKSNVKNRGVGLAILMNYVTLRNRGIVLINSGRGNLSAVHDKGKTKMTARTRPSHYPGTLVSVILRTDTLQQLAEDIEHEEFSW